MVWSNLPFIPTPLRRRRVNSVSGGLLLLMERGSLWTSVIWTLKNQKTVTMTFWKFATGTGPNLLFWVTLTVLLLLSLPPSFLFSLSSCLHSSLFLAKGMFVSSLPITPHAVSYIIITIRLKMNKYLLKEAFHSIHSLLKLRSTLISLSPSLSFSSVHRSTKYYIQMMLHVTDSFSFVLMTRGMEWWSSSDSWRFGKRYINMYIDIVYNTSKERPKAAASEKFSQGILFVMIMMFFHHNKINSLLTLFLRLLFTLKSNILYAEKPQDSNFSQSSLLFWEMSRGEVKIASELIDCVKQMIRSQEISQEDEFKGKRGRTYKGLET